MPFDGTGFAPNRTVEIIDRMIELLGPNGERWTKGVLNERRRGGTAYCMMGALFHVTELRDRPRVIAALTAGVGDPCRETIEGKNDTTRRFHDIQQWLQAARERALVEAG